MTDEKAKVIEEIKYQFGDKYSILDNTEEPQYFVGDVFPDLIVVKDMEMSNPQCILEIKSGLEIVECAKKWQSKMKELSTILYFVVPENEMRAAVSIIDLAEIDVKLATYEVVDGEFKIDFTRVMKIC